MTRYAVHVQYPPGVEQLCTVWLGVGDELGGRLKHVVGGPWQLAAVVHGQHHFVCKGHTTETHSVVRARIYDCGVRLAG